MSFADFPMAMHSLLHAVSWRHTLLSTATMLLRVLAAVGFTVLIWLLADAAWNLPSSIRAIGPGVAVLAGLWVIAFGLRPRRRHADADFTRRIEQAYPKLQERLLTCRELESQPIPATRTERWFRAQLRRETFSQLDQIDPARVIADTSMQYAMGLAALVLVCGFLPVLWWGEGYRHLAARWMTPWENHGWGRALSIVTTPRDGVALRDRDFTVDAQLIRYGSWQTEPVNLTLCWREQGESTWHGRPLNAQENDRYAGSIPHVARDVVWMVRGRGVESPWTITRVIDPPQVTAMTAVVDAPGYTGRASQQLAVLQDLSVLAGSRVRLSATWDQPLRAVELSWPDGRSEKSVARYPLALNAAGANGTVDVQAVATGPFSLRMITHAGIVIEESPRSLMVRADQPPVVQLTGPASLTVRPDDRHEFTAKAVDDFGLTAADLHIEIAGQTQPPMKSPALRSTSLSQDFSQTIDLQPWNLTPGTSVTLRLRVLDNREQLGPQEGWSTPQVLVISSSALPEDVRRLADGTRQSREGLSKIVRDLEAERATLRDIHQKTAAATVREKPPGQEARLQELTAAHQDLQEALQDWTAMLPDDGRGEAIREQIEQLLEGPLTDAAQKLAASAQMSPRDQIPTLSKALDDLATARSTLKKVDDALIARAALGDDLQTLRQLANQSDRTAESLTKDATPSGMEEAAKAVQQIQDELARVIQRRPEWQAAMDQAVREEQIRQAADQPASALMPDNVPSDNPHTSSPMPASLMNPVPREAGAELAQAREELQQAESHLMPQESDTAPASQALQAAAKAFRAVIAKTAGSATESDEERPPRETESAANSQLAQQTGNPAGNEPAQNLAAPTTGMGGKSNRNWGRLPTGLKTEILQGSRRNAHPDYATQVRRYFERIAQPMTSPVEEPTP